MNELSSSALLGQVRQVITQAREQIHRTINTAMVQAYWQIGRLIVEHEQARRSSSYLW